MANLARFSPVPLTALQCEAAVGRGAVVCLMALTLIAGNAALAQGGSEIGLPVVFVHGFCDKPDSFLAAESKVKASLEKQYPSFYPELSKLSSPLPEEYVAFYDGQEVQFQVPGPQSTSDTTTTSIDRRTRFFLADFNDGLPGDTLYQEIDANAALVAQISIQNKAQELAHIIWAIKVATGAPRVIVVAHSLGGLAARAYIENLSIPESGSDQSALYLNDIASLLTLDTPHGGVSLAAWPIHLPSGFPDGCQLQTSIDRTEMTPDGPGSLIPLLNYSDPANATQPTPLPEAMGIVSITSHWPTGNDGALVPYFPFLSANTQNLKANLPSAKDYAPNTISTMDNSFILPFDGDASHVLKCGAGIELLHYLTCTGDSSQTFSKIESAIAASFPPIANSGQMHITPDTQTVAPGGTVQFKAKTASGAPTIWSILEGAAGGSISPDGEYQAPESIPDSSTCCHVIAIDSKHWTQYAEAAIQVTTGGSGPIVTLPATAITSSSGTLNASVNSEGSPGYAFFQWSLYSNFSSPTLSCPNQVVTNCQAVNPNDSVQVFSTQLTALPTDATIYYQPVFYNTANGNWQPGTIQSFKTLLSTETGSVGAITSSGATLHETVNSEGSPGYAFFQWSLFSNFSAPTLACPNQVVTNCPAVKANDSAQTFSTPLTALPTNSPIYYQSAFYNTANGNWQLGTIQSFDTLLSTETGSVSAITSSSATLHETVNSEGSPGYAFFQWSLFSNFSAPTLACPNQVVTNCPTVKANNSKQTFSTPLTALPTNATIYYQPGFMNAANGNWQLGTIQSFHTAN